MQQTPIEVSSIAHQKLKIELMKALEMEQIHFKELVDMNHETRHTADVGYQVAHRKLNKLIISWGEKLWKANQELRSFEEQAGERPALGADYDGPFAAVRLKLYKDPIGKPSKASNSDQAKFRKDAIAKYQPEGTTRGCYWCPVSNKLYDRHGIRACHIVPIHLGPEIVDYLFGPGGGLRLYSADNCLMMRDHLGEHFAKGHFVLLPVEAEESPITRWKVQITNDDASADYVDGVQLKNLQGRELFFRNTARQAARFLYYHFIVTLLRNSRSRTGNHAYYSKELPAGKPFGSMGQYLRLSMFITLAIKAGDDNTGFEDLVESARHTTFCADDKLKAKEEGEIARRVLNFGNDGDEADDGDDSDDGNDSDGGDDAENKADSGEGGHDQGGSEGEDAQDGDLYD